MTEPPARLSSEALRLAGHVGQTALDRIAERGLAAAAELDQHIAAVRAELAVCQLPALGSPSVHRARADRGGLARLARLSHLMGMARLGGAARRSRQPIDLQARLAALRSTKATCPDVPFVSSALQAEAIVPVSLLLHYAGGFVEAGLNDGWWPGQSADATDWVSLRLAAICKLITEAEAAEEAHPDLRTSA